MVGFYTSSPVRRKQLGIVDAFISVPDGDERIADEREVERGAAVPPVRTRVPLRVRTDLGIQIIALAQDAGVSE